jgi:choline kinase
MRNDPSIRSSRRHARTDGIQAVILAAGRGSRLGPAINGRPKCLAPIGGRPLIEHQLELLAQAGIDRVAVVTGYGARQVRRVLGNRVRYFHNARWEHTEGLHSIDLCRNWVTGSLLVLNCDVLADAELLTRLLNGSGNAFAFDSSSGTDAEEMAVEFEDDCLAAMSKSLPVERTHGENVGVLYFERRAALLLFDQAEAMLAAQAKARLPDALQRIARYIPFRGIDVADLTWIEVDFPDDLDVARHIIWPAITGRIERLRSLASGLVRGGVPPAAPAHSAWG